MNRGTLPGWKQDIGWQQYTPSDSILRSFAIGVGAVTQLDLAGTSTVNAQYLYDRATGTVAYHGMIQFSSDATYGSGDDVWGLRLPVPAYRSLGGADLPVGTGMAWQGSAGNRNVPLRSTLMDPMNSSTGRATSEDYFAQFFMPYLLATGTGSIASAATSTTITHGLGTTPSGAFDIEIMPTAATTNSIVMYFVNNITSTTFDVNVRTAPGASTFAFEWKARAEPNQASGNPLDLLLNSTRPFGGGWASGYVLAWHLRYQARR